MQKNSVYSIIDIIKRHGNKSIVRPTEGTATYHRNSTSITEEDGIMCGSILSLDDLQIHCKQ